MPRLLLNRLFRLVGFHLREVIACPHYYCELKNKLQILDSILLKKHFEIVKPVKPVVAADQTGNQPKILSFKMVVQQELLGGLVGSGCSARLITERSRVRILLG